MGLTTCRNFDFQRNESNTETRDAIRALGRRAEIVTCDLADKESVKGLTKRVVSPKNEGGMGETIDILINCGGIQRRLAGAFRSKQMRTCTLTMV